MSLDRIRAAIDSERALLLPIKGRVTSPYFKRQCRMALQDLEELEYFFFGGGLEHPTRCLDIATYLVQMVVDECRVVEGAVHKLGYNVMAVPDDLSSPHRARAGR
jgi:hypothetical protein